MSTRVRSKYSDSLMALFSDNHANPPDHNVNGIQLEENPVLKENFTRDTAHFPERKVCSLKDIRVRTKTSI